MENLQSLWDRVVKKLELMVSAVSFDLWIKPIVPLSYENNELILIASSPIAKNQLIKNHYKQIDTCLEEIFGLKVEFAIFDEEEKKEYLKLHADACATPQKEEKKINPFNEKYIFDNFVVGKSNQIVYAACRAVAENPGRSAFNPLFIYGGVGLGKTHLLHSIGNYIYTHNPDLNIVYCTCEKFTNDYIESIQRQSKDNTISDFRSKYRNVDILMVDDIQFITNKKETQEEFFHTFNDLYQNNKQIIIASDRAPSEIATLTDRLRSRFSSGITQDIQAPDFETRLAILKKKAGLEKYTVDDDVFDFIAENVNTNIREMEGFLSKVHFLATLYGKESASLAETYEAFKEQAEVKKEKLSPETILDIVCEYYGVDKNDVKGKKKSSVVVEPRMMAIYLIYDMLGLPLVSIGKIFGRDHTTIIHARDKITEKARVEHKTKNIINELKNKINNA